MEKVRRIDPFNIGWLQAKLSEDEMNHLWKCIKNGGDNFKDRLAGNNAASTLIKDEGDSFFNNVLSKLTANYCEIYPEYIKKNACNSFNVVDKPVPLVLKSLWVNYQKQHEFNPLHDHTGLFSFVVWMKIPTDWEDQKEIPFAKNSNSPGAISSFQFIYNNILGETMQHTITMNSKIEGEIVFFPAALCHQVYPFYNCEEERISISGNISFNVDLPEPHSKESTNAALGLPVLTWSKASDNELNNTLDTDLDQKEDSTTPPEWGGWNKVSNSKNDAALSWGSNQEKNDKWWNQSDTGFGL